MTGGRTNPVWRIETGTGNFVCKLFTASGTTPLFANDPDAEVLALRVLAGTNLAPRFIASQKSSLGVSLIYHHVPGEPWSSDPQPVARVLKRLHDHPVPNGLAKHPCDAVSLINQGRKMLTETGKADRMPPPPQWPEHRAPGKDVFLHGDPVPGNILQDGDLLTLIDWQCPAQGDACHDLALFLSPAMQVVNGNVPLSTAQAAAFLSAYDAPETTARYHALAPVFHWRMAAYCLWKAHHGDHVYDAAAGLELAHLQQG